MRQLYLTPDRSDTFAMQPSALIDQEDDGHPAALTFAWPILPDRSEAWRRFIQEMLGTRRAAYEASRRRLGITRELTWLAQVQRGEVAMVYVETGQPDRVMHDLRESDRPFDRWYRQQVLELHGIDLQDLLAWPPCELIFAWQGR